MLPALMKIGAYWPPHIGKKRVNGKWIDTVWSLEGTLTCCFGTARDKWEKERWIVKKGQPLCIKNV